MSEILQIRKGVSHVDDIIGMQYHTYTPYTTSFNNNDEIRIVVQSQDLYVQPSESYVVLEFKLLDKPMDKDYITLASTALGFFNEIRYELNGFEVDRCKAPTITSLLKKILACKSNDATDLAAFRWLSNVTIGANNIYRLMIPLKFVFGFCDDYTKVIANCKHELILVRNRVDTNAYISNKGTWKFDMIKVQWKIPHVTLNDHAKMSMLRTIERREEIPISFRSWDLYEMPSVPQSTRNIWTIKTTTQVTKPRYVVVAFQTNRNNNPVADPTIFDHCNVTNMRLYLNNERYPYDDMNLKFTAGDYCEIVKMLSSIQQGYYNGTQPTNPVEYHRQMQVNDTIVYPFDCSRTDESIKNGMVDVRIEMETIANFPADTTAYCLIVHDNAIRYTPATGIVARDI